MKRPLCCIVFTLLIFLWSGLLSVRPLNAQPGQVDQEVGRPPSEARFDIPQGFPQPKNGDTYVIAHRGVHNDIPENTLAAYKKAIEIGCDFVEIDVRTTSDNHIVSIHNANIDAYVAGKSGKVREMTLEEIRSLDIGKRAGVQWEGTQIPTFEEILQLCKGEIGIYLDLKDADVGDLVRMIREYQMERQVVWCIPASNANAIGQVVKDCPSCVPMPDPGSDQDIEKLIATYDPLVIAPVMRNFSAEMVEIAHAHNVLVFVDDSGDAPERLLKEWEMIINLNTNGIQTDHPGLLIEYLLEQQNNER